MASATALCLFLGNERLAESERVQRGEGGEHGLHQVLDLAEAHVRHAGHGVPHLVGLLV